MTRSTKNALLATAFALTLIPAAAYAHGSGDKNHSTESFDFRNFEEISVSGVYELDVQVGEAYGISVSGHDDEMENLKIYEKDGVLHLAKKKKKIKMRNSQGIDAVITVPKLNGLSVSGVATGDVVGIDADDFELTVSGVGEVSLSGTCNHMTARVSGVGEIKAKKLECKDVHVKLSGVGEAQVYASESIDVKASGVGEVDVWGSPSDVTKNKGFMSDIEIH